MSDTHDGYLRICQGVDNLETPVLGFLHGLVLLAYGAEQPHDPHGQGVSRVQVTRVLAATCARGALLG